MDNPQNLEYFFTPAAEAMTPAERLSMIKDLSAYGIAAEVLAMLTDKQVTAMHCDYFPSPLMSCVEEVLKGRMLSSSNSRA